MDWRSINFDWNRAKAFLVTAEEGSFTAAARALGVSQPTLSRQVAAFESELDILLFERVGRGLQLTETGIDLVEHIRVMSEAATRVSTTAAGHSLSLSGTICITVSETIAAFVLPPIIDQLRTTHPSIDIEIVASNLPSDLSRREADIAIRSFRPTQPELVAQKICETNARLYASPAYIKRIGPIEGPADLSRGDFINFDQGEALMTGLNALGLSLSPSNFPIVTSSHLVQWELAKQGAGICIMTEEIGDIEPRVARVLPSLPPIPVPMWLVSHRELRTSRRVRVVFDFLAKGLKAWAS